MKCKNYESTDEFNLTNMIYKQKNRMVSIKGILVIFDWFHKSKSTYKNKESAGPFHSNQTKEGKDPLSS